MIALVLSVLISAPTVTGGLGLRGVHVETPYAAAFSPEALETYLPASHARLLVAAAGDDLKPSKEVALALRKALEKTSGVELVLDDATLGKLAELDDEAIVAKAKKQPADVIVIVRVFGDSAVGTIYRPNGETVAAFNVRAGDKLAKRTSGTTSDRAFAQVATINDVSSNAQEEFEKRAVWFEDWTAVNQYGQRVGSWSEPKKGKYGEPLEGEKFYDYIGRSDLAAQYKATKEENNGKAIIGGIVAGAGLVFAIVGPMVWPESCNNDYGYESCSMTTAGILVPVLGGLALAIGGGVYAMANALGSAHPVELPEARAMADQFNKDLRAELSLTQEETARRERSPFSLGLSPWVSKDGGGVAVGGTFQ